MPYHFYEVTSEAASRILSWFGATSTGAQIWNKVKETRLPLGKKFVENLEKKKSAIADTGKGYLKFRLGKDVSGNDIVRFVDENGDLYIVDGDWKSKLSWYINRRNADETEIQRIDAGCAFPELFNKDDLLTSDKLKWLQQESLEKFKKEKKIYDIEYGEPEETSNEKFAEFCRHLEDIGMIKETPKGIIFTDIYQEAEEALSRTIVLKDREELSVYLSWAHRFGPPEVVEEPLQQGYDLLKKSLLVGNMLVPMYGIASTMGKIASYIPDIDLTTSLGAAASVLEPQIINGSIPYQLAGVGSTYSLNIDVEALFGQPVKGVAITQADGSQLPSWLNVQPMRIGSISGSYNDIDVLNGIACITSSKLNGGIDIANVSDASNPVVVGHFNINGTVSSPKIIKDNVCTVISGSSLIGINISDISRPIQQWNINFGYQLNPSASHDPRSNLMVLSYVGGNITVIDMSTPTPMLRSSINTISGSGHPYVSYIDAIINDNMIYSTLFLNFFNEVIQKINITNPCIPKLINTSMLTKHTPGTIAIEGEKLYITDFNNVVESNNTGLSFKVFDTNTLQLLKSTKIAYSGNNMVLDYSTIYMALDGNGFQSAYVDSNNNFIPIGTVLDISGTNSIAINRNTLYVQQNKGIDLFDLSKWTLTGIPIQSQQLYDVTVNAINNQEIRVYKHFPIFTDQIPFSTQFIPDISVKVGNSFSTSLIEDRLFEDQDSGDTDTLSIKISKLYEKNPNLLDFHVQPYMVNNIPIACNAIKLVNFNGLDYILDTNKVLHIINSANQPQITNIKFNFTSNLAYAPFGIDKNTIYVGAIQPSVDKLMLYAYDISNTTNPEKIGGFNIATNRMAIESNFLDIELGTGTALFNTYYGNDPMLGSIVSVIDINNPSNLFLKASLNFFGRIAEMQLDGNNMAYLLEQKTNLNNPKYTLHAFDTFTMPVKEVFAISASSTSIPTVGNVIFTTQNGISYILVLPKTSHSGGMLNGVLSLINENGILINSVNTSAPYSANTLQMVGNTLFVLSDNDGIVTINPTTGDSTVVSYNALGYYTSGVITSGVLHLLNSATATSLATVETYSLNRYFMSLNPTTNSQAGDYPVTLTATDTLGGQASINFNIHIQGPPTIYLPLSSVNAVVGQALDYFIVAKSPNAQTNIALTTTGLPSSLTFNPRSATFSGTPVMQDRGIHYITIFANDGITNPVNVTFPIIVHRAPKQVEIIVDQVVDISKNFSFSIPSTAVEPDINYNLTVQALQSNGDPIPANIVFNPNSMTFDGMFQNATTQNLMLIYNDNANGQLVAYFNIIAERFPEPILDLSTMFAAVGHTYQIDLRTFFISDNAYDTLTYSLQGANWLTCVSGLCTGIPKLQDIGEYQIQIKAVDLVGGYGVLNTNMTVVPLYSTLINKNILDSKRVLNKPPTIDRIPDQQTETSNMVSVIIPGKDSDGDPLTYTLSTGDATFLTVNPLTGAIEGRPGFWYPYPFGSKSSLITARATDPENLTAATTFQLTVNYTNSGWDLLWKIAGSSLAGIAFCVAIFQFKVTLFNMGFNLYRNFKKNMITINVDDEPGAVIYTSTRYKTRDLKRVQITKTDVNPSGGKGTRFIQWALKRFRRFEENNMLPIAGEVVYLTHWLQYNSKTGQITMIGNPACDVNKNIEITFPSKKGFIMEQINIQVQGPTYSIEQSFQRPQDVELDSRKVVLDVVSKNVYAIPDSLERECTEIYGKPATNLHKFLEDRSESNFLNGDETIRGLMQPITSRVGIGFKINRLKVPGGWMLENDMLHISSRFAKIIKITEKLTSRAVMSEVMSEFVEYALCIQRRKAQNSTLCSSRLYKINLYMSNIFPQINLLYEIKKREAKSGCLLVNPGKTHKTIEGLSCALAEEGFQVTPEKINGVFAEKFSRSVNLEYSGKYEGEFTVGKVIQNL